MARIVTSVHIDSDLSVARTLLAPGSDTRRGLLARAQLTGIHYRRLARQELYDPSSPFAQKDQDSISDPKNFKTGVSASGTELVIEVDAPAAKRVEEGNQRAGRNFIHPRKRGGRLALELKKGREGEFKDAFVARVGGKVFLMVRRVRTVPGKHLLARAVRIAFR